MHRYIVVLTLKQIHDILVGTLGGQQDDLQLAAIGQAQLLATERVQGSDPTAMPPVRPGAAHHAPDWLRGVDDARPAAR